MATTQTWIGIGGGILKLNGRLSREEATTHAREWAERQRAQAQRVLDQCESGELSIRAWRGRERLPLLGEDANFQPSVESSPGAVEPEAEDGGGES